MTNSEIKKRLPNKTFDIEYTNFEEFCEIGKKLSEVYSCSVNYSKQEYDRDCKRFGEMFADNASQFAEKVKYSLYKGKIIKAFLISFPNKHNANFYIRSIVTNELFREKINLDKKVFLKYFEEDYFDKLEFIELSQYEKGLLKISINKFIKDGENFGEELLNIDLNDYVNILGKLSE